MSSVGGVLPIAAGVGVGQTIGKLLLFLSVRRGKQFRFVRHQREKIRVATVGPVRQQFRSVIGTLLRLVGTARWGLPIVFLAAVVGFPPLYAVALLAGATRMSIVRFGVVVLVGRITRFVLVALGVTGLYLS
jgi:membrane protein YqaA with SNARE-associated domain